MNNPFKYFVLLLFVSVWATAQTSNSFSVKLNHIALSVSDANKSAAFYSDVLNLQEITNRTEVEGIRWFSLGEDKELHLISTLSEPFSINKAIHFALTTSDFDQFMERIQGLKIPYADWPGTPNAISVRADGIRQIFFQDPDGHWIEMNSVMSQ